MLLRLDISFKPNSDAFFSDVNVQNFMSERKQLQVKKLFPFEEICDILKKNRDKKLI